MKNPDILVTAQPHVYIHAFHVFQFVYCVQSHCCGQPQYRLRKGKVEADYLQTLEADTLLSSLVLLGATLRNKTLSRLFHS